MTPEQKALFNADVKETHDWFIMDVLAVRSMAKVEDMQGQCWSGRLAASKMLVTGIKDTLDDLLMYIGEEYYEAFEGAEPSVGNIGTYAKAISAEVTPEQGKDEDGTTPISGDKKKKKKKKADGEEEDDEEDEKELPDDPGCNPIITDDKTKCP
jgi:ClpP class serine protease